MNFGFTTPVHASVLEAKPVKRLVTAALVVLVVLAGGWLILRQVAGTHLNATIAQFREQLGPEGHFSYAIATAAPLRLGADFTNAQVTWDGIVLRASAVALGHVFANRIGHASLRGVQLDAQGSRLHASDVEASHVSLVQGVQAGSLRRLAVGDLHAEDIEVRLSATPGVGARIRRFSFSAAPDRHGGSFQDATAQQIVLLGDKAPVAAIAEAREHARAISAVHGPGPVDTFVTFRGLALPAASQAGTGLGAFGYDGAHGTMRLAAHYDPAAATLTLDPWTLVLDRVGQLTLALGLDQLPTWWQADAGGLSQQEVLRQSLRMRLTGLSLTYDDAGLASHVISALASRAGVTPAQFRALLTGKLEAQMQFGASGPRSLFQQQAVRFLNDPRRLVLSVNPPMPLPLLTLALLQQLSPQQAAESAGLSLRAD